MSGLDSIANKMNSNSEVPVYAYRFDWGSLDNEGMSVLPGNKG
ncbi:MAG: hypothetical protein ACTSRG_12475 [Candidatus Helarchaeota archaeon]